jgi:hypothetical protein
MMLKAVALRLPWMYQSLTTTSDEEKRRKDGT